jgi:hypothetical protein
MFTVAQRHTDHIANGQKESRHSLPILLYFFIFATAHFFNSILDNRKFAHLQAAQANPLIQSLQKSQLPNRQ